MTMSETPREPISLTGSAPSGVLVSVTEAAAKKVLELRAREGKADAALRLFVKSGGCSGFSYGMVLDEVTDDDQVFETDGIKVIVDPMSLRYLEGAEVDYKEDLMGGGFAIKNPNAKSTCGCGSSFQADGEGAPAGGGHQH